MRTKFFEVCFNMRAVRKFLRFMYPTSTVLLEPVLYWTIHKNFVNSFFNIFLFMSTDFNTL